MYCNVILIGDLLLILFITIVASVNNILSSVYFNSPNKHRLIT